jgi:hypothetical protein
MAGYIGKIEPFDDAVDTWTAYTERLEQYSEVNGITSSKHVPALLSGGKTYALLRNLTTPDKPKDRSFSDILKLLQDHLSPKPLVIAEQFRFHKRDQKESESINEYIAEIRKLSEYCDFQDLNDTLRDRFVCGLRDEQTQKKLLSVQGLTLDKAIQIAVAMEIASKDALELQGKSRESGLEMSQQHYVPKQRASQILHEILNKHSAVFSPETGSVKGIKANLIMKESAKPVLVKARSLAYALKQ